MMLFFHLMISCLCFACSKGVSSENVFDVYACGAVGDGTTDDTIAIQNCTNLAVKAGGVLYFPPSRYLVTSTITIDSSSLDPSTMPSLSIIGIGWSSTILWSMDDHLFVFASLMTELTISNLKIQSILTNKTSTNAAFLFENGCINSLFHQIFITNEYSFPPSISTKSKHSGNYNNPKTITMHTSRSYHNYMTNIDTLVSHITSSESNPNLLHHDQQKRTVAKKITNYGINSSNYVHVGSGIIINGHTDTVSFRDNLIWEITGTGISIGFGSEVRITGGRILGISNRHDGSIGIHCTGYNGGVHIENTDINALEIGLLLNNTNGAGSNREIFINEATFDSNGRGIVVMDNSYINIVGLWAASSDYEQIYVAPGLDSPLIVISGGTIFNGGVYGGMNCSLQCNGMTVNSGTFMMNGVIIRNNLGKGIWIPNENVVNYMINNCYFYLNNIAYLLNNNSYLFENNMCYGNGIGYAKVNTPTKDKHFKLSSTKVSNIGC